MAEAVTGTTRGAVAPGGAAAADGAAALAGCLGDLPVVQAAGAEWPTPGAAGPWGPWRVLATDGARVCVRGPRGVADAQVPLAAPGGALARDGGRLACLVGRPRWADPSLEAVRRERGAGASLLAAWRARGEGCLQLLQGAFALALVDREARTVLLATDRFATHPLAWARARGAEGIVFGTSVGAVRAHPAVQAPLDPQAVFDYLYFHCIPAPGCAFTGIAKLRAGERLLWRDGSIDIARYWFPPMAPQRLPPSRARALEDTLRQAIGEAVARAMVPGSPAQPATACFLSGGLDSSTVAGMAAREADAGSRQVAYAMGFAASGFDEMGYARIAAEHFGLELRERYVRPEEIGEAMVAVARWYDEPFGNSSAVPTFICASTAAQDGVRRLLAGDGGDELFAGNTRYVRQLLFDHFDRLPAPARAVVPRLLLLDERGATPLRRVPLVSKAASYVAQARLGMPARYESWNYLTRYGADSIITPEVLADVDTARPWHLLEALYAESDGHHPLHRMLHLDWQLTLADNDLRKVGGMCAAAGVEVAYPMLDEAVVAVAAEVPANLLISRHRLRHFYKQAFSGFLPQQIISKKKHGFGLPFGVWLKECEPLREVVLPTLEAAKQRGVLRPDFIDEMSRLHREEHANYYGGMLWLIAMLELWLQANV